MAVQTGEKSFVYEVAEGWGDLPQGWSFREVVGVAVNSRDEVFVFNRSEHPVIVFDQKGGFLRAWGEEFVRGRSHGIYVDHEDFVYCIDDKDHVIFKCTAEGQLVWTLGERGKGAPRWSGEPFHLPLHVAVSPRTGDIFVADGYGNARIHRCSSKRELLLSWGSPGVEPGQFAWPHNIVLDSEDNVYVADRENHRIQVFNPEGHLLTIWHDIFRPTALCLDRDGYLYVGELCPESSLMYFSAGLMDCPGLGHRISVYDLNGKLLARVGDPMEGEKPGQFIAPHGIAVDSHGDIYVGEVSWSMRGRHLTPPRELRSLQKLIRRRNN